MITCLQNNFRFNRRSFVLDKVECAAFPWKPGFSGHQGMNCPETLPQTMLVEVDPLTNAFAGILDIYKCHKLPQNLQLKKSAQKIVILP